LPISLVASPEIPTSRVSRFVITVEPALICFH
jgi:hypothetical protein